MIVSGTIPISLWGHKNEQVNTWPQATVHLVDETNKRNDQWYRWSGKEGEEGFVNTGHLS